MNIDLKQHATKPNSSLTILHDMERFRQMGSALYIAAHPDDENTELLAYLARGRKYRTAYLSLTRGDGGQNVLGPEFGYKLGVSRTQELLAARRIDGANQYFSRAIDFGFSKDYEETLKNWDREQVLSDVVRIIRQFRPDVLLTRFAPTPGGTHGHHTASTVLALEAFKLSGDPNAFPEQHLPPWQPKRIFWNVSRWQKDKFNGTNFWKIKTGGIDAVSGEPFMELAELSRGMHKTQGFDLFRLANANEPREEVFQLLDGPAPKDDILDDVDTTWKRVPGGGKIQTAIDAIISDFNPESPESSLSALLKLRSELAAVAPSDSVVSGKRVLLDEIIQNCLGLKVETTVENFSVIPGQTVNLHHTASLKANLPVTWDSVKYPGLNKTENKNVTLKPNSPVAFDAVETVPLKAPLAQPYWLQAEGTHAMVQVDDAALIGTPENSSSFPIEYVFNVAGQKLVVKDEPVQVTEVRGVKIRRRLDVISPVWLRFISDVRLFPPGGSREIEVEVTAAQQNQSGTVEIIAPAGWKVEPSNHAFHLHKELEHAVFKFDVTAPNKADSAKLIAAAELKGQRYQNGREEVTYPHIPPQLLQPLTRMKTVSLDLKTEGKMVGYLPGAGDSLALNLQEMGYTVKVLDDAHLTADALHGLDAVVVGVRAYNVRKQIGKELATLIEYAENGGTVIVQYNTADKLKTDKLAPYELRLSRDRVTDENSKMTFLAPDSPVLNTPNKITDADFAGWVQERGLYFPDRWDERFQPILSCADPGERPTKGVLLVARCGKGHFVYTGLAFFRQLPAGVPGAYRLFANLLALHP